MNKLICVFLMCITLITLSSCGGLRNMNFIVARDYIMNETSRINISVQNAYQAGNYSQFSLLMNINELSNLIERQGSKNYQITTQIFQDEYILISKKFNDSENMFFFLIKLIDENYNENKNRFVYFSPIITLGMNDNFVHVHIPYHLLKNINPQMYPYGFSIENGSTFIFNTIGTIEEFYDFYAIYEHYKLEKNSDTIILRYDNDYASFELKIVFVGQNVIYSLVIK